MLFERNNKDQEGNIKSKIKQDENEKFFGSTGNVAASIKNMNTSKIQKFIEKQKKRKAAKRSLE